MSPYNLKGGDTPSGTKWMEKCVADITGTNKRTNQPYTKGEKIAICKAQYERSHGKASVDETESAVWTSAYINDLPDSAFLYIEPGGKKVDGKTEPKSLRHFPYKDSSGKIDLPHLRNAIARIPQSSLSADLKARLQEKARKLLGEASIIVPDNDILESVSSAMSDCMKKMMDSGKADNSEDAKAMCEAMLAKSNFDHKNLWFVLDKILGG